jgi:DNA-binding SARP family transcriptional activator
MEVRVLGPLEVRDGERVLSLGGPRTRSLMAALVLHGGEAVSVERLCDDLWGDAPPPTAVHTVQVLVSRLRQALGPAGAALIATRPPGYAFDPSAATLDLARFEALLGEGRRALADGRAQSAAATLREALALWRGAPLADVADAPFVSLTVRRLLELRLAALEERVEADLACGRHVEVAAEIEALVAGEPLRERLRAHLMLALYRCGRQADALEAYQQGRRLLARELGLEPSPMLRRLERAILRHDPALQPAVPPPAAAPRPAATALVLAPDSAISLERLATLATPLAEGGVHELVLAWLVPDAARLSDAIRLANEQRRALAAEGVAARAAAFTSRQLGRDLARLASEQDAVLVLVPVPGSDPLPAALRPLLVAAPCDVGLAVLRQPAAGPVCLPFGGATHEWAALELGAALAAARGCTLHLLGVEAEAVAGRRDASRLLANAALAAQGLVGVDSRPVLVAPGPRAALAATADACVVLVGLPDDWQSHGLGAARAALVRETPATALVVCRGLRPGGLMPANGVTRFSWTH